MTRERDFDRVLEAWFRDGASEMPDRVYDSVLDRIERVPQRRLARLTLRFRTMNRTARAALIAAVVVIGVVGFAVLARPSSSNVATPPSPSANPTTPATSPTAPPASSPSPTPTESPSASVETSTTGCINPDACEGVLDAGSHSSTRFYHSVTFTASAGWVNVLDDPGLFGLERLTDNVSEPTFRSLDLGPSIYLLPDLQAVVADASCNVTAQSGVGSSSAALATSMTKRPGIVASKPASVTIGGVTARMVDVQVAPSWSQLCRWLDANGVRQDPPLPYIPLIRGNVGSDSGEQHEFGPIRPGRQRYIFVDVPGGHTVAIVIDASPAAFDKFVQDAMPIIQTMTFKP